MAARPVLTRLGDWARATGYHGETGDPGTGDPRPELLVAAADHAVAAPAAGDMSPVSTLPWGHAGTVAAAITTGESPLCHDAARLGVDVSVHEFPADAPPSGTSPVAPHSPAQWIDVGRETMDARADAAVPLVLTGTVGTGATTTAAALVGVLCNVEPVKVVGRGGGPTAITDEMWKHKTVAIRDLMFRVRAHRRRPVDAAAVRDILDTVGTPDIAFLAGLLAQSAARRTPVILDGVTGLAAGLLADALTPGASRWWLVPDTSGEPSGTAARQRLSLTPVVGESLGAPEASSGLLVLPLLDAAASRVRQ
ncbi:nicotinate-nucleotide--dimethylbenzimidazole phosphoribosyltransferase [Corynebacterium sp. USCH3]|uniref:nicotinate-nucleotide--dimethylbenzimidazole phosphoribosyltransferase n=1 Tax=Corynebacterium sp. USCH3 TaxID=3024840 RepID=UPI00309FC6E1